MSTRSALYDSGILIPGMSSPSNDFKRLGTLEMRIGPMFSQKSTWLNGRLTEIVDVHEKMRNPCKVLKINYNAKRTTARHCDEAGSTHNSSYGGLSPMIDCVWVDRLSDVANIEEYEYVGIDEGQFIPDLLETLQHLLQTTSINFFLVGLDGDFEMKPFGQILWLIPLANKCKKLCNVCALCAYRLNEVGFRGGMNAAAGGFTKRLVSSTEVLVVGGSEAYLPACRSCHMEPLANWACVLPKEKEK